MVPYWLTGWRWRPLPAYWIPVRVLGGVLIVCGAVVVGQALLQGRFGPFWYALPMVIAFVAFVRWFEEPDLARRFGVEYAEYQRAVPAWWPRLRPWRPPVRPAVSDGAPSG